MFDLKFECDQLAAAILEREPCSDDPDLFEKHCASLSTWIKEAVENWFNSPDDVPGK